MTAIPNAHQKVPMMFRAQIPGRSQLQYLDPQRKKEGEMQDVERWANEWIDKAEFILEDHIEDVQTSTYGAKSYEMAWRFITNGGQDDGLVRPVIGARGIPFYPGSSMKGAFRAAAQRLEAAGTLAVGKCDRYCGDEEDVNPGLLRFHGAYPTNDWTDGLLDLVHPQQGWQVKTDEPHRKPRGESAYAQVSLYQPTLRFGLSSIRPLTETDWTEIWQIWEKAIATGPWLQSFHRLWPLYPEAIRHSSVSGATAWHWTSGQINRRYGRVSTQYFSGSTAGACSADLWGTH